MTRVVRVPRRVIREARLRDHWDKYNRVRELVPHASLGNKFVPGEGDVMSRVVFIGEAPGADEDAAGRPFIGRSGNLLAKLFNSIGLNRRDVYITNLLKYRPPNNADPTPKQASAARVLMQWELKIIDPAVVVPLGRFATEVFYPNPYMQSLAGTCRVKDGYLVVPMFHPSYGLRSSVARAALYEHIQIVKDAMGST